VVFEGSGVENEPRGLALRDDIVNISMGANGAVPTDLDPFVDALSQLMSRNAQPTAWVMHPQLWGVLSKLKEETTTSNVPLLGVGTDVAATGLQRRLLGLPVVLHSGLTVTEEEGSSGAKCGSVYLGQWDRVIVARWTDALMEIDGSRLFHRDMSELRAIVQVDVAVPTPTAVCRIRGVRGHLEG
jgi:HK97 family phage major capsid protein